VFAINVASLIDLAKPHFVKIDIEGHEFRALKGFENYLSKNTIFLIEVLDDSAASSLSNFFSSNDYLFVNIDDDMCTMEIQRELTRSFKWNVLIVPKGKFSVVKEVVDYERFIRSE
jgi:hypothetical protein